MQGPGPRIQNGCFAITTLKQNAKPITCLRVPLIRPVLRLIRRVGRIAALFPRCPTDGRTTATRRGQIPDLQPLIFTD
jgi:hypothetical protein